jgi:two-component system KDP operon response regulator KdpE
LSVYKPRILVIDDEPQIHRFLGPALDAGGYEHVRTDTAADGLRELARKAPDAVLLDLGLPDMDGKQALEKARAFFKGPIIVLSARDRETEKIDALDLGANDYVEKPFGVGELLARIRAALRGQVLGKGVEPVIVIGDLTIDLMKRLITRAGVPIRLSPREYDLLAQLIEGGGKVVTHRQLLTAVWGPAHEEDVQYLRVFVGQLRQKIEQSASTPSLILTEPGVGYRWVG